MQPNFNKFPGPLSPEVLAKTFMSSVTGNKELGKKQELQNGALIFSDNKKHPNKPIDYIEDAYLVNDKIAIIADGVSDSPPSPLAHLLVRRIASGYKYEEGISQVTRLIEEFFRENKQAFTAQALAQFTTLCVVVKNKDNSKSVFIVGDSSVFIDGKEHTKKGHIYIYEDGTPAMPPDTLEILENIKTDNIILATDEVAKLIRKNTAFPMDAIVQGRKIYSRPNPNDGLNDDVTMVDLRGWNK